MSIKYKFGDKEFKTQIEVKKFVGNYLQNNNIISENDKIWIVDLLKHHEKWENKSKNMKEIIIMEMFGSKCFGILQTDGSKIDISYLKCLVKPNKKTDVMIVFRNEIMDQKTDYRNKYFIKNETKCSICNNIIDDIVHIDHEILFCKLVKDFITKNNIDLELIEIKSFNNIKKFKDGTLSTKWKEYHKLNAILRITCSKCNLTREK